MSAPREIVWNYGGGTPLVRTISFPWAVVASDNQRHGLVRGRIRLTARYRERLQAAGLVARGSWQGEAITGPALLRAVVYAPDRRRRDVTNLLKHLCDALTGVAVADDAQFDVVTITRGPVDRSNPRVVVCVAPLEDDSPITRAGRAQETQ